MYVLLPIERTRAEVAKETKFWWGDAVVLCIDLARTLFVGRSIARTVLLLLQWAKPDIQY